MTKVQLQIDVVKTIAGVTANFAVSGGLAWHLMSVPHDESKNYHDHKDVDVLAWDNTVIAVLKSIGFTRQYTKYDNPKFVRYTNYVDGTKVTFDVFFEKCPTVTAMGIPVVHPKTLASFYRTNRWQKNLQILKPEYLSLL